MLYIITHIDFPIFVFNTQ